MFAPVLTKKYAVTDLRGFDGAMYSCQTNNYLWAWIVLRILQRGKGSIVVNKLKRA